MLINGREISQSLLAALAVRLEKLQLNYKPVLCDIVVGDDPVSLSYVNIKGRKAHSIGIEFRLVQLPELSSTATVVQAIKEIQDDLHVCGLIVQLPLPHHIDRQEVLDAIMPEIDVDCIGTQNKTAFYSANGFYEGEDSVMRPPTADAIRYIIHDHYTALREAYLHKSVCVIGQGDLVGKPIAFLLKKLGLHVSVADKTTEDLESAVKSSDIVVSGVGIARLITGNMIKPGAVVIDAGTSESGAGIAGDVDLVSVEPIASFVSPVPGGVGPVTVAKLLENVVQVAKNKDNKDND